MSTTAGTAVSEILELARSGATGEYICAGSAIEIHVYLQRGRIAWATSSAHPLEFARFIKERGRIDAATFRQVIDECRREKLPLGETLVAWRLVTWDDVRAALRHQIGTTFALLSDVREPQTMFLQRERFTEYNPELTLDVKDLAEVVSDSIIPPEASEALKKSPSASRPPSQLPPSQEDAKLAESLLTLAPQASWIALLRGSRPIFVRPSTEARVPQPLVDAIDGTEADFVALRSSRGTLIGVRLRSDRTSLWCRLESDARYNATLSALCALNVVEFCASQPSPRPLLSLPLIKRGADGCQSAMELSAIMDFGADVLSTVVMSAGNTVLNGAGRSAVDLETCVTAAQKRMRLFSINDESAATLASHTRALDFGLRTVVTRESDSWCFGAELPGTHQTTVWVLIRRGALQGLGWACLTALIRGLGRNEYLREAGAA